jgi:hypothetical protein
MTGVASIVATINPADKSLIGVIELLLGCSHRKTLASPSEIESSSVDTTKLRFRLHAPDGVALISEFIAQQKLDRPGLPVRSADYLVSVGISRSY